MTSHEKDTDAVAAIWFFSSRANEKFARNGASFQFNVGLRLDGVCKLVCG